jgi:hypothetical protein
MDVVLRIIWGFALPCVGNVYDMTNFPRYIPMAIKKVTMLCKQLLSDW